MNLKELSDFHNEVKKLKAESQEMFSQAKAASDYKAAADTLQVRERAILLDMEMNELIAKYSNPMMSPQEQQVSQSTENALDKVRENMPKELTTPIENKANKTKTILD